jgi:hypothetical protein
VVLLVTYWYHSQIGARDMASGFMNMLLLVVLLIQFNNDFIIICWVRPANSGWTIYPPLSAFTTGNWWFWLGMTLWLVSMAIFIASSLISELYSYCNQFEDRRDVHDQVAFDYLGIFCDHWCCFLPVLLFCCIVIDFDRSFGTSFSCRIYIAGEVLHYQGGSLVLFEHLFWFLVIQRFTLFCYRPCIASEWLQPMLVSQSLVTERWSCRSLPFLSTIVCRITCLYLVWIHFWVQYLLYNTIDCYSFRR